MLHNIKLMCLNRGISMVKACKDAGLCYESVFAWDDHSPSVDKVKRLAKALGCTIDELVGD